jgi:serine O-acetyltransferase
VELASRVGDAVTTAPLREILREDFERNFRSWGRPGLHAIVVYRIGRWARTQPRPVALVATLVHRVLNVALIRNVYGTELSVEAVLGRRVLIGHHQGVQIPAYCIIGDDTVIRHNVTIGFGASDEDPTAVPHIGRDVKLGAGCVLMGPIAVGDGARIGPNAIVQTNVPADAVVFAPPARIMKPPKPEPVETSEPAGTAQA